MRKRLFSLFAMAFLNTVLCLGEVRAQSNIVPDDTLGNSQSSVVPIDDIFGLPVDEINGGLTVDNNLFHSFLEFNVDENRGAYFRNSSNNIENILSRVTGESRSDILGTLGIINSIGITSRPNLLFINPNGILFGPEASLDLPAAFVATTADSIQLGENGSFSAAQPQTSQLLAINPSALLFSQSAEGAIINQAFTGLPVTGFFESSTSSLPRSTSSDGSVIAGPWGLQVSDGQRIALVGSNVLLDGTLTSVGGTIDVGSVLGPGRVTLNLTSEDSTTGYAEIEQFGNIRFSSALINASGAPGARNAQGGRIQLQGARLFTTEDNLFSSIAANTEGVLEGRGIFINATEELFLDDAVITTVASSNATGNGGDIRVESPRIFIRGELSSLLARHFGEGSAGDIDIQTSSLILREGAAILTSAPGLGNSGNITVNASELVDAQGKNTLNGEELAGGLQADSGDTGQGGMITINTNQLLLSDGAAVSARTNDGVGGSININANDLIDLSSGGDIRTQTFGLGNAGNIRIETRRIRTGQDSDVTADARFGSSGNAGNIEIIASESVEATASGGYFNNVILGTGNGGELTIRTPYLSLRNGGNVSSETLTFGRGGNINIVADVVEVIGDNGTSFLGSQITASGISLGDQPLGDITIKTRQLIIRDGGQVSVNTSIGAPTEDATGATGNIHIQASESIEVTGLSEKTNSLRPEPILSRISATTRDTPGGNITLATPRLNITNQAEVSVSSEGRGNAGDINISGGFVLLDTAGRIAAESITSDGGNLTLDLNNLLTLRNGAGISTSAGTEGAGGDGGNINLTVPLIAAIPEENSDITANAFSGEGGQVNIQATAIFGITERPSSTVLSDITASSELGISGTIDINDSDTGFIENSLTELSDDLFNPEAIVASSCVVRSNETAGRLVLSGDRIPKSPNEDLSTPYSVGTVQSVPTDISSETVTSITEPQAIYQLADGRLLMGRDCDS